MAPGRRPSNRTTGALVYDPEAHREFVTGFRRRKQERRTQAAKDIEANEKQTRRDERKERRAILKRTADRARGVNFDHSSDEDEADDKEVLKRGRGTVGAGIKAKRAPEMPIVKSGGGEGRGRYKLDATGAAASKPARVSKVYAATGDNAAQITTTVTPLQTFADSHFSARLPKSRPTVAPPPRITRQAAPSVDTAPRTRLTSHSKAKKIGKMHRHSKLAKVQRDRKTAKANRTARNAAMAFVGATTA
jgi:hypothetical protein